MKTILIIEDKKEDALKAKQVLIKLLNNDIEYDLKILPDEDKDQCAFNGYYNDSNFLNNVSQVIKTCKGENKPVISILLDIFLTTEENETLNKGSNYIAKTSYKIFETYGDVEKNGTFNGDDEKKNIFIMSRFPQYPAHAKDLSGNVKWGGYYLGKSYLFNPDDWNYFVNDVKDVLSGTKRK